MSGATGYRGPKGYRGYQGSQGKALSLPKHVVNKDFYNDTRNTLDCDQSNYSYACVDVVLVPCGPGTYYDHATDRCLGCPPGTTQLDQAQTACR